MIALFRLFAWLVGLIGIPVLGWQALGDPTIVSGLIVALALAVWYTLMGVIDDLERYLA